jgi:hypothetical protein
MVTNYSDPASDYSVVGSTIASSIDGAHQRRFENSEAPSSMLRTASSVSARDTLQRAPSSGAFSNAAAPPSSINMPLSSQELDFLHMLRNRPGNDYPEALEHWKATLVALTEKNKRRPPDSSRSSTHQYYYCVARPFYNEEESVPALSSFDAHMEAFEDIFDFPAGAGFELFGENSSATTAVCTHNSMPPQPR